jgi:hypothetical protein
MMPKISRTSHCWQIQNIWGELKGIQFDRNDTSIKTVFSIFNPNGLVFILLSIPCDITIHRDKIASGGIGYANSTVLDCPKYCYDIKPVSPRDFAIPLEVSIWIQSALPFVVNGTYRYENSSSGIVSNQFNLISQ